MFDKLSSDASVVAFYGLQFSKSRIETSYRDLVEWFDTLGYHPDTSNVSGKGFSDKLGSFERNDQKIKKRNFSDVNGFSLFRLAPGGQIPGFDWSVNAEVIKDYSCCIVGVRSSIAFIPGELLLSIARKLIRTFCPIYGIGYLRSMDLGPTFFAMGGNIGTNLWGEDRKLADRIQKWSDLGIEERCYEKGLLRDVYPWNFLTDTQLDRLIEGVPLREWIKLDENRGIISYLEGNMWLWEVQEAQLLSVRIATENAGLIFD
ncbi:MAG: hypothetical protein IT426_17405 [Pirellulales bacterium]|nr:hypothetical protein [Pirellulales bacterium]